MGLFDFIKTVGEKIIGNAGGLPKAEDLKKVLDALHIGTDDVQVKLDGDKAILSGSVKDQSTWEKVILAAGNVLGISKVDSSALKTAAGATGAAPVFYTVKKGDTLYAIAEAQYGKGNGNKYNLIFEANRPMLTSPDKIYPGQSLRIPPLS